MQQIYVQAYTQQKLSGIYTLLQLTLSWMYKRCNKLTRPEEGRRKETMGAAAMGILCLVIVQQWILHCVMFWEHQHSHHSLYKEDAGTGGAGHVCMKRQTRENVFCCFPKSSNFPGWKITSHAETDKETPGNATARCMYFCHFSFVMPLKLTYRVNQMATWYPAEQACTHAEKTHADC